MIDDLDPSPTAGLPPAMAEIVEDFQALPDRERLQLLLEFSNGLRPLPAAALGVVTGVGGGLLRDVIAREVPARRPTRAGARDGPAGRPCAAAGRPAARPARSP